MTQPTIYQRLREATDYIQSTWSQHRPDETDKFHPQVAVILGSGLGPIADEVQNSVSISYSEIPHFHGTSVEGHAGKMILGDFHGVPAVLLQGRFHFYEGYPMDEVVFPTRTLCSLGIDTLVLTNAAGGVNPSFNPTDVMIIEDHINLMGDNPLKGPNIAEMGPRFPDMTEAYDHACIRAIEDVAEEISMPVRKGVYAAMLGPTYETPAEIRMLQRIGADAVGMSTVPECIAANHLGVRVVGISLITNFAAGLSDHKLTHQEVIENSKLGADAMIHLLSQSIPRLAHSKGATAN